VARGQSAHHPPAVQVRRLATADRESFLEAMRASHLLHHPWVAPPRTSEQFRALLRRAREPAFEALLATRACDSAIVGFFNISEIVRGSFQSAFLGYGGVHERSGQGYMTLALEQVLRHAFLELRLHRVEANIQPANVRSLALVQRCGFQREGFSERYLKVSGRWRDHERWAMRSEQWPTARAARLG